MKILTITIVSHSFASAGMIPLGEHVDHLWTWQGGEGKWELTLLGDDRGYSPDEVFLPLSDKPYLATQPSQSGARLPQQNNANLSFTGVAPGANIWYALASNSGLGEAYPGFRNNQTSAIIAQYFETDPRLPQPQSIARPWITSRISSVFHDGPLSPKFSMWKGTTSSPRIWASTSNGQTNNLFLFAAGDHNHVNWTFGATGIYRIGMRASAFLGAGQTMPTGDSDEVKVTFTVGPVAYWQATQFSGDELEIPAISGMDADPDGDGEKNLIEYAFGTDPKGGTAPLAPGLGKPVSSIETSGGVRYQVISYPRRKSLQLTRPLIYTPQFSENLLPDSWQENGPTTVTAFTGAQSALNAEWEKVEFRHPVVDPAPARGFARVMVSFPE